MKIYVNIDQCLVLQVFGANEGHQSIGFQTSSCTNSANHEDIAFPYVQLLAEFREQVRNIARNEKVGKILKLCDRLRDEALPNLGVKLEDQEGMWVVNLSVYSSFFCCCKFCLINWRVNFVIVLPLS